MAAEFIGSTVLVTLRSPPCGKVSGVVAEIVGQQLTLNDVTWLASGYCSTKLLIDARNILDLEVAPEIVYQESRSTLHPPSTPSSQATTDGLPPSPLLGPSPARDIPSPALSSHRGRHAFLDPAILSYGKPTTKSISADISYVPQQFSIEVLQRDHGRGTPTVVTEPDVPTLAKSMQASPDGQGIKRQLSLTTATLSEPFNDHSQSTKKDWIGPGLQAAELETNSDPAEQVSLEHLEVAAATRATSNRQNGKRSRRNTKARNMKNAFVQASIPTIQPAGDAFTLPFMPRKNKTYNVMYSNCQTPLVEADAAIVASPSNFGGKFQNAHEKGLSHRELTRAREIRNGWATEDATDIQELGDFDFAGNLSKFDKQEVFDQLRRDDTTDDKARLVYHNRLPPKAVTSGGKNLHWTENVLDVPQKHRYGKWNSEAGESEDEMDDAQMSSGRNSRRNVSRSTFMRPQSRKGSAKSNENQALGVDSRLLTTSFGSVRQSPLDQLGSPKPGHNMTTSPFTGSLPSSRPSLRISGSNKLCPCLSPLQMLEFEQFAISELGLSEDIMTENAARGIADSFFKTSTYKHEQSLPPFVFVAAGNHRTGARAIAAGRHLRNHGIRISITIMGLDRQEDLLDCVKQQVNAYRKAAGTVLKPHALLEGLRNGTFRPTFMIDALLGIHTCFEDLRRDDQAFFYETLIWVNRSTIEVLSIDVPSGLDPSNGEITFIDDEPLALVPSSIIFLGAPKPLLLANLGERGKKDSTQFCVVDIGISNVAWKRLGNRRSRGIDFGDEWLVKLEYQSAVE